MRIGFWSLLFLLFLGVAASYAVVVDRIVAVVNDDVITLSELDEAAAPLYRRYLPRAKDPVERENLIRQIRRQVLNQMIDEKLLAQEAEKLDIKVSPAEVDRFIARFKEQNGLSDEKFQEFLAAQGLSYDEYRQKVAEQIKRLKLVQGRIQERIVITDEEIEDYYRKHYLSGNKTRYELAAIVITGPEAEEKAREAYQKLKSGEDFRKVAAEYSSLKGSGEGLGSFRLDELAPEVREVISKMKPGEISPPIKVGKSWQIFKLLAIHSDNSKPLGEIRAQIEQQLRQEKIDQLLQKWLKELRQKAYIRVLL
ncbi:MAG: hypothetical protein GXO20_00985 [Thermodesulfobacteria bacterium]|nr:hypothetical protein [Thermodesulfobacteriota bacterium]